MLADVESPLPGDNKVTLLFESSFQILPLNSGVLHTVFSMLTVKQGSSELPMSFYTNFLGSDYPYITIRIKSWFITP